MALTFSGILDTVKPVETYQTRNGDSIKSREVVITTVEQYPQVGSFTLRNDLDSEMTWQRTLTLQRVR